MLPCATGENVGDQGRCQPLVRENAAEFRAILVAPGARVTSQQEIPQSHTARILLKPKLDNRPRRNRVEVLPRCENRLSALVLRKCLAGMVQHKMRALWTKRDFGKKRRLGGGCGGEQDASSGFQQLLP